jgi:hypothetical protein
MVTTNKLQEKSAAITEEATRIGITRLYITENHGTSEFEEDEYIPPSSIIVEKASEDVSITKDQFLSFKEYLRSELLDIGIDVLFKDAVKYNLSSESFLFESSKHLLDSAIDITQIDTGRSWKVQFQEQRDKKKDSQISLKTKPEEIETIQQAKRHKPNSPSASTLLSNVSQVYESGVISAEELQKIRGENSQFAEAMKMLLQDKRVIIPTEVRRQLQKQFPNLITAHQLLRL